MRDKQERVHDEKGKIVEKNEREKLTMKRDGRKRERRENNYRSNEREIKVIKMMGNKRNNEYR